MNLHSLIFSNESPTKYYRHILFWVAVYVFKSHSDTHNYNIGTQLIDMMYCYGIIYWVVPQFFFTKRYILFFIWLSAITFIVYIVRGVFYLWLYDYFAQGRDKIFYETWFHTSLFIHSGPIMRFGLFITCKMLKNYYLEIKEQETLVRETSNAELQLLKSQVQPHFLFNTLNNIYSFSLNKSPLTADLVLQLHQTINYMNHDCQAELVSVEKEIKMLQNYMALEKVRYGQRLNLTVSIEGNYKNKLIAPLLLIPFVENSFKHGASKMLEHPWINLQLTVVEHSLKFNLTNSKPATNHQTNRKNGIGLSNVQKRLMLLYRNNYLLKIDETSDSFQVLIELPLQEPYSSDLRNKNAKAPLSYSS